MRKRKSYLPCSNCGYFFDSDSLFIENYSHHSFALCRSCTLKLLKDCARYASETAGNEQEQDFFNMVDSRIEYDKGWEMK